ncbi:MAG: arylamine N-acetyltransferase [Synergistaceae bacterium]|nr:arylamine N-acetyltransferase [Synergistaceae bacterium]
MQYGVFTEEQTMQYLKKLGFEKKPENSLDSLSLLLSRHQQLLPFENLDCMAMKKLSLTPAALYDKIVAGSRGGLGLELNSAFYMLLAALGFKTESFGARLFEADGSLKPELHRINCVELEDRRYVCDAGLFVETARVPLLLECDAEQDDGENFYRFAKNDDGSVLLEKKEKFFRSPLYVFKPEPFAEELFEEALKFCVEADSSPYNKGNKISIHTHNSFAFIYGDTLKYKRKGRVTKQLCIEDRYQMNKLLDTVFHINFGEIRYVYQETENREE